VKLGTFIEKNEIALSAAKKTLDYVRKRDYQVASCAHPLSQITFRASRRPPKIVCTGTNHEEYRRPIGVPFSPVPLVFLKFPSAAAFKAGDVLRGEIQRIGVLRNPVEGIEANPKYAQQINVEEVG
jgi:2-keto-4-pentenoate hydratase/2-oxohepta-3-ene-1,7-dioic acid hydratase in catechol pathway